MECRSAIREKSCIYGATVKNASSVSLRLIHVDAQSRAMNGISPLELLDSVEPLKSPVAFVVFSSGLERFIHEHRPQDFPRVSTRGHFNTKRLRATPVTPDGSIGSLVGLSKDCYISDGHDEFDYDMIADIPGMAEEGEPEELLLFVHGWLADKEAALGRLSLVRYSLERNGYPHPVAGFTWDTRQTVSEWRTGKTLGRWNGSKLARFVTDYKQRNPETKLRLVSNSLGAHPLFSALKELNEQGYKKPIESATVIGGSVTRQSVSSEGEYADAIGNVVKDVYNYWTPYDRTLLRYYPMVEFKEAVGGGSPENSPDNFHDRGVLHVPDHFSFLLPTRGCIHNVVEDFGFKSVDEPESDRITKEYETFKDLKRIDVSDD